MKTNNYMNRERKRNRLKEYDYSQGGYYFVTICVDNRKDIFGNVKNGECFLNNYGSIVKKNLENLKKRYSYIKLDYYVIMPNHIHTIIIIDPSAISVGTGRDLSVLINMRTCKWGQVTTCPYKEKNETGLVNFRMSFVKRWNIKLKN